MQKYNNHPKHSNIHLATCRNTLTTTQTTQNTLTTTTATNQNHPVAILLQSPSQQLNNHSKYPNNPLATGKYTLATTLNT